MNLEWIPESRLSGLEDRPNLEVLDFLQGVVRRAETDSGRIIEGHFYK